MRYYLITYGCTLNRADSDRMDLILSQEGHVRVDRLELAEVVVFNTCGVKEATHNRVIETLRKLRSLGIPTVVTGCMYVAEKEIRKVYPEVVILPTMCEHMISRAVDQVVSGRWGTITCEGFKPLHLPKVEGVISRIPISEGCLGSCTYCFTRVARGILHSYKPVDIRRTMEYAVQQGAREIQITSQDTGAYGLDIGTDLPTLLGSLLDVEGDYRIRLGMINPQFVIRYLRQLTGILSSSRMYRFIHIPVQSGSDRVLRDMKRGYTREQVDLIVKRLRESIPDITIATDLIIGYPTETEDDFLETLDLIKRDRFDVVNVSRFSPRPYTEAKHLRPLDNRLVKERIRRVNSLIDEIIHEKLSKWVGREVEVIITEKQKTYTGRTDNYLPVGVLGEVNLGDRVIVSITDVHNYTLIGELVDQ